MAQPEKTEAFAPPYGVPWKSFYGTFERMAGSPVPNRIDRSFLTWMSGLTQTYFMAAARSFELTDANNAVTPVFRSLVSESGTRDEALKEMILKRYAPILKLAEENVTTGTLLEKWKELFGQEGETRRKAITFFLHAAKQLGLYTSPHWEKGVSTSGRTNGAARKARTSKKGEVGGGLTEHDGRGNEEQDANDEGDSYRVDLSSGGGVVELRVSVDLFKLTKEDRDFVLELVDALKNYGGAATGGR